MAIHSEWMMSHHPVRPNGILMALPHDLKSQPYKKNFVVPFLNASDSRAWINWPGVSTKLYAPSDALSRQLFEHVVESPTEISLFRYQNVTSRERNVQAL